MEQDDYKINIGNTFIISPHTNTVDLPIDANIGDIWIDATNFTMNNYTITGSSVSTITLDDGNIDLSSLTIDYGTDFVDRLPDFDRVESMCKEYPALEKAYENFKVIYKMVEQDYNGKQKERE